MVVRDPGGAERTVLVGLVTAGMIRPVVEDHLDELERLVETAGGVVVARMLQERRSPDPATLVGAGFVEGMALEMVERDAGTVVFDEDLTGSQVRNLERALPESTKVLDRAAVILDIFAQRARSREAQTQVELAQLSYLLPRLTRRWRHLSRQAGGIGTRGVGETQLEIDRRLISKRISQLKAKLRDIERDRRLRRRRRETLPTLALVGYTNAGKSSLFRRLADASVLVEDRLFATLDPRARRVALGDDVTGVLTDTVGFIRKLPHHLVAPFRSTLEEATGADLVLHVVDAAHPAWREHLRVGDEVLEGLDEDPSKILVVFNKADLLPRSARPEPPTRRPFAVVSAATGQGVEGLLEMARRRLLAASDVQILHVPLAEAEMVARAVAQPHQMARRFGQSSLDMAVRADRASMVDAGLGEFLVAEWAPPVEEGGE